MNKKENWLRTINNDSPAWIPQPWEPFVGSFPGTPFIFDAISGSIQPAKKVLDEPYYDAWGVQWILQTGSPASIPLHTADNLVIKDITCWEDFVKFPELDGHDWSFAQRAAAEVDRNQAMVMPMIFAGVFELSHALMGFEDALCNYMLEPEAMTGLITALADWKIGHLERVIDKLKPDVIHYHDDWGSKHNLFLDPEVWRAIIKPQQQRIVDFVKSAGIIFMHHSDSICEPIVEDMAEMGIDIWQGVIPQNDIVAIQRRLNGRMALMGGIDAQVIDHPDYDEQVIRDEVRRCIDTYCPQNYFIPCIPNLFAIHPEVERIYLDEIKVYGQEWFKNNRS
ncbi:MAG: uroporphyrinogen decarboxylase family protein [Saccharofermentanales bacterium]|nr:hypothetical protein [Clostridiaceae bacterium]